MKLEAVSLPQDLRVKKELLMGRIEDLQRAASSREHGLTPTRQPPTHLDTFVTFDESFDEDVGDVEFPDDTTANNSDVPAHTIRHAKAFASFPALPVREEQKMNNQPTAPPEFQPHPQSVGARKQQQTASQVKKETSDDEDSDIIYTDTEETSLEPQESMDDQDYDTLKFEEDVKKAKTMTSDDS